MIVDIERLMPVTEPVGTLSDYLAIGGGRGLAAAREHGPEWVIDTVAASGLRGRGGGGFPTGTKWATGRNAACPNTYVVGNAAEGEPGTFKDRYLIRRNPYQVLEGLAIAALAVGAGRSFIVINRWYEPEIARLCGALDELREAGLLGPATVHLVLGPDNYPLGKEKAAVENNVETLAHVPEILRRGPEWFRSSGTDSCPGTMVFTISGDVLRPAVAELPLGIPLRLLVDLVGGGVAAGHRVRAVIPGAAGAILTEDQLDTRLDFDSMRAAGSELGSAGLVVYDDTACVVAATLAYSRFLADEPGARSIIQCLERIERGDGSRLDIDTVLALCGTATGAAALVRSALTRFAIDFDEHLRLPCPLRHDLPVPRIADFEESTDQFQYYP